MKKVFPKKIVIFLMLILLIACTAQFAFATGNDSDTSTQTLSMQEAETSGQCGENLFWEFDTETGVLTISGTGPMDDFRRDIDDYDTYVVYEPWSAFINNLSEIRFPEGMTRIGANAFYNIYYTRLTNVTIPQSVESIGESAFLNIPSEIEITILNPDCVIETHVAYGFRWSLMMGAEYEKRDDLVFCGYPGSTTEAYANEMGCTFVPIGPHGDWGELTWSFVEDTNTLYVIGTGEIPEYISETGEGRPWAPYAFSIQNVVIRPGVTAIGVMAFQECWTIRAVEIPDSVTDIGFGAFYNCLSLESISISRSVSSIGPQAFDRCFSLMGIYVSEDNAYYSSDTYGVLFNKSKTVLIQAPGRISGTYHVPASVTEIGRDAFHQCTRLTEVVLPGNLSTIGDSAFSRSGITSIVIPEGVTTIRPYAFYHCPALTRVTLPAKLTTIDDFVFAECTSLMSIILSDSITEIGSHAFAECYNLSSVKFLGDIPQIDDRSFDVTTSTVYYPAENATYTDEVMRDYGGNLTWVPSCQVLEGEDSIWNADEDGAVSIRIDGDLSTFISVCIDGNMVDPENYTLSSGSTIVTFHVDYLKKLSGGVHDVTVNFTNDTVAYTTLTVVRTTVPGDVNSDGVVDNKDLTRLFQYLSGWDVEVEDAALDVNGDDAVDNKDLTRLFQYLSGWDVEIS